MNNLIGDGARGSINNYFYKTKLELPLYDIKNSKKPTEQIEGPRVPRTIHESSKVSLPQRYEVVQVLGKGSYGIVCSVRDLNSNTNNALLAVKKITNIFYKEILIKRAIRELKFIKYFRGHKNIVSLLDVDIVLDAPYDGLYCYQELIDYDLAKVVHSSVLLTEFHIKYFFYQILCGLKYIHSADVLHRDLKPGNILCTLNGTLKICDFGLARGISQTVLQKANRQNSTNEPVQYYNLDITNYVATRWYRAPELILSHNEYDKSIDIWSCGCILAEFYGRKPVFMGKDAMHQIFEIIKVIGSPSKELLETYGSSKSWTVYNSNMINYKKKEWSEVYPHATAQATDLMENLMKWVSKDRYTVEEAIEHPFLSDVRNKDDEPICPYGEFDFLYEYELHSMQDLRNYLVNEVNTFKSEKKIIFNKSHSRSQMTI
ncbi:hypothetical protein TPHA_0M01500 [Tetrapisispora phaffii CBS 4417]|uniref:Protein kinase domain-containing protein n=1 Tax=Tetrapisispora phaffii (strain ATCC 24235 / CBS 4417 / NBRC 1672 / NRRL Y-8282 / UCD 70-5) TaxID=1071381 RepID=G8C0L0_TETPH|nr:hypothetical protein TPHA_0M01500 [Tetrapisispora phaffii CBS 4417]CCE65725.1 hypothetical protein TPHA_0M01500 [Tetrapisispora phaffii CBS 4417]